jgi:hypothetical protein
MAALQPDHIDLITLYRNDNPVATKGVQRQLLR